MGILIGLLMGICWDDGNVDANFDGKFDGNLMVYLMMDSKDCLMTVLTVSRNIIIKSANVDKVGGGGKTLIHKMWTKTPPLTLDSSGMHCKIHTAHLVHNTKKQKI